MSSSLAAGAQPNTLADDSAATLELVPSRDLWDEAYAAFRRANSQLAEQYEESVMRIDQEDTRLAPVGSLARQAQLSAIITKRLDSIEKDQYGFTVAGRRVELHEQSDKIVRIVMFAKDFVSSAISTEPHAALAWAGVCVLLPLLLNPISQRDEATQGFESIPFIVHRYQVIERLRRPNAGRIARRQADTETLVTDLENKMVQLYSKILEYQIRLMRQSFHNGALRYGLDVFKVDDWKSMLSQMKELDFECSRLAREIGQEELEAGMREKSAKIDALLQSWNRGFQTLQEQGANTYLAVDAHARENRGWREKDETRKLLQALRAKNPYRDQLERTATRQPGTCNWFLKHPKFQKWRGDAHSKLTMGISKSWLW